MDQNNRTSSVYSDHSSRMPLHLETRINVANGSTSRPSSRAASYTPSYMSNLATKAPNGQRSSPIPISQTPTRTVREPTIAPPELTGVLLIFSPGKLHPSLLFYLEILLERLNFSSVVFAASKEQEMELKQLRMDVFALLGKLRKEASVIVETRGTWGMTDIEATVQSGTKTGQGLQGVLCCPELVEDEKASGDVLDMDESRLEEAWTRSVAFLHRTSKATFPLLLSSGKTAPSSNGHLAEEPKAPFFLTTQPSGSSVAAQIAKVSFDALLTQLVSATQSEGFTVGYAEAILVPKPRPATPQTEDRPILQPNAYNAVEDHCFTPSESPTKLWNMWALQNDTPTFDS